MDLFIDEVADALGYSAKQNKSASFYMGIVSTYNADDGYYLVVLDGSYGEGEIAEPVRATAYCDAVPGDRVLCVVNPDGQCMVIGRRTNSGNNDVNPIVKETRYKFTRTDGVVFYWCIRLYADNWIKMTFSTNVMTYSITNSWGSLYESTTHFSFAYPQSFTTNPTVHVDFRTTSYGAMVECYPLSGTKTTGMSAKYYLIRGTSQSNVKGYWCGTIEGRWSGIWEPVMGGTVSEWE